MFQESTPFAVIGSNTIVEVKGQRVRGRLYPWGIVEGQYRSAPEYLHFAWDRLCTDNKCIKKRFKIHIINPKRFHICVHIFLSQWRISPIAISSSWGTCWFAHTCTTWKTSRVTCTMKTTERNAYSKWQGKSQCISQITY